MSAKNGFGLTPPQDLFARQVAGGLPLAQAYVRAYPKAAAWKAESVRVKSSELASNVNVAKRIQMLQSEAAERAVVSAERLVREIARLAFSDPRKLVDAQGKMLALHELDDDTAAALASVEIDEYGKVKYKLWDKGPAQERLAKFLGLYEKDNRQKTDPLVELTRAMLGSVVGAKGLDLGDAGAD